MQPSGAVMSRKNCVALGEADRVELQRLLRSGRLSACKSTHARILLKADASAEGPVWGDQRIAEALDVGLSTIARVRRRYLQNGLTDALNRWEQAVRRPRLVCPERLRELVCQSPRNFGKKRSTWTLELLAETCLEVGITKQLVSDETIRRTMARAGITWRRAELWMTSPDPHYAEKKARRDRLIRQASQHSDWVLGFLDEVWWSRLARPSLRAWSDGDPLKLHVLSPSDSDPDPVALCCYGLLRSDSDEVMVRFVEGRPTGDVTNQFLSWICQVLQAESKERLIVVWDDASWHAGRLIREWVRTHNRVVRAQGGVQIVLSPLPVKSPWLNNIETRWAHAKRAILEPDRKLTAKEVASRVCEHFGCELLPFLRAANDECTTE